MEFNISKIDYLDKINGESFLTLSNDEFEIEHCFLYTGNLLDIKEFDKIRVKDINCFDVNNLIVVDNKKEYINYDKKNKVYTICCKIIAKEKGMCSLKGVYINLGLNSRSLPGDCNNDDYVLFNTSRLDLNI